MIQFGTILQLAAAAAAGGQIPLVAGHVHQGNAPTRLTSKNTTASGPNIVFILTDDQDSQLGSVDYMPLLKKHMIEQGTSFPRHYCTTAICCPSRVTIWTGQLAHNTNVTDVVPPYGGYPKFVSQGYNSKYLPVWLEEAGYNSYYVGKLFNSHNTTNYNDPFAAGFKHTHFLLDPYTYEYLDPTFQHDQEAPVNYPGQYNTDMVRDFGLDLLDDAVADGKPFFLTVAPVAPHSNVNATTRVFTPPVPAARHAGLFNDTIVPRLPNFNPDTPSGGSWVHGLKQQGQQVLDYNDHYYRQRLRSLQAVDELIDATFQRLEAYGLLNNTYVFFAADNGFHIGQHRLHPGKTCGYEEDINVPMIVRGPGVAANATATEVVSHHADLAPTFMQLLGLSLRDDFDGTPMPITTAAREALVASGTTRNEHANVEFWGNPGSEGKYGYLETLNNNTYKSLRIIGDGYSLYYSVWCDNDHEMYDMTTDPYQMNNLVAFNGSVSANATSTTLLGRPVAQVANRLNTLLFVLKSCKNTTCVDPWGALQGTGTVTNLAEALDSAYDELYADPSLKVQFNECAMGQILSAEGPQFEGVPAADLFMRDGLPWDVWT